jgi:hypothetical protein
MTAHDQLRDDSTVTLRRQPAHVIDGQAQGPCTGAFEIICCDCGDDPGLDYREVSPRLQLIRGPYPIAVGIDAFLTHLGLHDDGAAHRNGAQLCGLTDGAALWRGSASPFDIAA